MLFYLYLNLISKNPIYIAVHIVLLLNIPSQNANECIYSITQHV